MLSPTFVYCQVKRFLSLHFWKQLNGRKKKVTCRAYEREWRGGPSATFQWEDQEARGYFFSNISKSGKANAPFSVRTLTASNGVWWRCTFVPNPSYITSRHVINICRKSRLSFLSLKTREIRRAWLSCKSVNLSSALIRSLALDGPS